MLKNNRSGGWVWILRGELINNLRLRVVGVGAGVGVGKLSECDGYGRGFERGEDVMLDEERYEVLKEYVAVPALCSRQ